MKKYFVNYYRNFANTYNLAWAETPEQLKKADSEGWEQITRKEAERLCSAEKYRRKSNPSFSGFADIVILPIDYQGGAEWINDPRMEQNGYIIDYK